VIGVISAAQATLPAYHWALSVPRIALNSISSQNSHAADVEAAANVEADMKMWEDAFAVLKPPPLDSDEWKG
jgi:hypothetical protein